MAQGAFYAHHVERFFPYHIVFYAIYFGKQFALKTRGIRTNRLTKGDKPARTRKIETALLAATYGMAAIQYISLFWNSYIQLFTTPQPAAYWVAAAFCRRGFLLACRRLYARSLEGGRRPIASHKSQATNMVTDVIYRVSRNPAFVGFDPLYAGSVLISPNILMLLFAAFAVAMMHLQIPEEEKHLLSVFGGAYAAYKSKTPRYIFLQRRVHRS
jgi:protein-S-isoprenylcysteine O-methyltransferase Ste14